MDDPAELILSGTIAGTTRIGNREEVFITGAKTTTTAYYYFNGHRIGLSVNGTISYLASDLLGSAEVALSSSGSATASVLYGPYGTTRYSNGAMPTDYVFTGQRGDVTTGLDYYGARYYDPVVGQFTSADSDPAGGLNHYAYVHDDPETLTDPTGHGVCDPNADTLVCVPPPEHGKPIPQVKPYIIGHVLNIFQPQEIGRNSKSHELEWTIYGQYEWIWSNGTKTYADWLVTVKKYDTCDTVCHHDQSLDQQAFNHRLLGVAAIALGYLVDVFSDVAGFLYGKSATIKIEDGLDAALLLINLAQYLPYLNSSLATLADYVIAGAHLLWGLFRGALAAINKFGWLGTAAVNVAVDTGTALASGPVGALQQALMWAAGPVVNNLLSGGANLLMAFGNEQLAVAQQLIDEEQ